MRLEIGTASGLIRETWRVVRAGLVLIALALLAQPASAASAFKGRWQGPWTEASLHQSGEFLLLINGAGAMTGVVTNGEKHGVVRGRIAADGTLEAVYSYDGKTFYAAKGQFSRENGHLRGTAHYFTSDRKSLGSSDLDLRLERRKSDEERIAMPRGLGVPLGPSLGAA